MVCNSQKTSYNVLSHSHFHVRIWGKNRFVFMLWGGGGESGQVVDMWG